MAHSTLAIVLAAGEGTRMKSDLPKVLHKVAGRSLLAHALHAVSSAGVSHAAVVVSPNRKAVKDEALRVLPGIEAFEQNERRGTAHAALMARPAIARGHDAVIVLFGDTPHVSANTVQRLAKAVENGADVAAMGFRTTNPFGYGRFLMDGDTALAIREEKDATPEERKITLCSGGLIAFKGDKALQVLDAIDDKNVQHEFYLTAAVEVARAQGLHAVVVEVPEIEAFGVNDRVQLATAEATIQNQLRRNAMLAGVTMQSPETVFLSADTVIANDVTIEPNVYFGPGVTVETGAVIHAYSHLEGCRVGRNVNVGPFARLRPGADLGENAKVGNFVEIKNADVGAGAKISHLSYIGDAKVGADVNIGAGTITCNYDGYRKYVTDIGQGAFIGSNSSLVAPVKIGSGAFVGSGSVVTNDVPADALAIARGQQVEKPGWAEAFRNRPENLAKKK